MSEFLEIVRKGPQRVTSDEPMKEPPKAWRNKWRALFDVRFRNGDPPLVAGEDFWGKSIHPSREIALEKAKRQLDDEFRNYGENCFEYLGAFPVEAA